LNMDARECLNTTKQVLRDSDARNGMDPNGWMDGCTLGKAGRAYNLMESGGNKSEFD
jgi:hypothetical protein